jgi:hypothetical protein
MRKKCDEAREARVGFLAERRNEAVAKKRWRDEG